MTLLHTFLLLSECVSHGADCAPQPDEFWQWVMFNRDTVAEQIHLKLQFYFSSLMVFGTKCNNVFFDNKSNLSNNHACTEKL